MGLTKPIEQNLFSYQGTIKYLKYIIRGGFTMKKLNISRNELWDVAGNVNKEKEILEKLKDINKEQTPYFTEEITSAFLTILCC